MGWNRKTVAFGTCMHPESNALGCHTEEGCGVLWTIVELYANHTALDFMIPGGRGGSRRGGWVSNGTKYINLFYILSKEWNKCPTGILCQNCEVQSSCLPYWIGLLIPLQLLRSPLGNSYTNASLITVSPPSPYSTKEKHSQTREMCSLSVHYFFICSGLCSQF